MREISLDDADNARLANFSGPMEQNLRHVEERLGVEVRRRGHQLQVFGAAGTVDNAAAVLRRMFELSASEAMSANRVHLCVQELGFPAADEQRGPGRGRRGPDAARRSARPRREPVPVPGEHPPQRPYVRYRTGRYRQDLPRGRERGGGAAVGLGPAHRARPSRGRGRRASRVPARRPRAEGRPVPPADVRRALRDDGIRSRRASHRAPGDRGGAARVHARPLVERLIHHPRRGPEHDRRADEDVPDPPRLRVTGGRHRRHHADRPSSPPAFGPAGTRSRCCAASRASPSRSSTHATSCATRWCSASSRPTNGHRTSRSPALEHRPAVTRGRGAVRGGAPVGSDRGRARALGPRRAPRGAGWPATTRTQRGSGREPPRCKGRRPRGEPAPQPDLPRQGQADQRAVFSGLGGGMRASAVRSATW